MEHEKDERTLGLSAAQVAGSALAAVSGAILASTAGVTGTVIGAAVASVVATVGAAIYTWSLRRTTVAVRKTAAQVRQAALVNGPLPRTVVQGPLRTIKERAAAKSAERDPESSGTRGSGRRRGLVATLDPLGEGPSREPRHHRGRPRRDHRRRSAHREADLQRHRWWRLPGDDGGQRHRAGQLAAGQGSLRERQDHAGRRAAGERGTATRTRTPGSRIPGSRTTSRRTRSPPSRRRRNPRTRRRWSRKRPPLPRVGPPRERVGQPASASVIASTKASRSPGFRLVIRLPSTTTSSSTQLAPAFFRSRATLS